MFLSKRCRNKLLMNNWKIGIIRSFYDVRTRNDTIFAPSTSIQTPKGSPLAVVRVSGRKTGLVLSQLTRRKILENDQVIASHHNRFIKPRHATLTKLFKPNSDEVIDTALALWFPEPDSYTGEHVCELHIHGSQAIMSLLLSTLSSIDGLRPAEAGEFTRRAVLNKKLSIYQAESLPDLIASRTDQQRRFAQRGFDLSTKSRFDAWISQLMTILAHLEASIDFGEDYIIEERDVIIKCIRDLSSLSDELDRFIKISTRCKEVIQSGLRAVILGQPNSGKSSLMNLLCRRQKSIVSNLSGTTRDIIEHNIDIGGNSVVLCDTAGLRNLSDLRVPTEMDLKISSSGNDQLGMHSMIEAEGIKNALEAACNADVIIYMIDSARWSTDDSRSSLIRELEDLQSQVLNKNNRQPIVQLVVNKIDLLEKDISEKWFKSAMATRLNTKHLDTSLISCSTMENYDQFVENLATAIQRHTNLTTGDASHNDNNSIDYVNERHLSLLNSSLRHMRNALELENTNSMDRQAQHVREAMDYLSRIVGSVGNEEVIDIIFKDFCIGK